VLHYRVVRRSIRCLCLLVADHSHAARIDQREESAVLLYSMLGSPATAVDSPSLPNRKIMSADRSAAHSWTCRFRG
jgi:hypothetical protein